MSKKGHTNDSLTILNDRSILDLSDDLRNAFKHNKPSYFPFIDTIRFPRFKSLVKDTQIKFDYPVTILVGENGCNKTSILQALYGSPAGKSLGRYWFETEVDKIVDRNAIIYSYYQKKANKRVEVLKSRIKDSRNPDYWEPSRPLKTYDMKPVTKEELLAAGNEATTRWDPIDMNVVYCDCKEYVSAYDLFFYHYDFRSSKKYRTKNDYIRHQSKALNKIINDDLEDFLFYNKNVVKSNYHLDKECVDIISYIMGQAYSDIQIITHSLYTKGSNNSPSKTIFLRKKELNYSEAFAGTGESRVTLLVEDIFNAPEHSLILLDEPELSLHPTAIKRLEKFLLQQSLSKKQQIVVTTHSPYMIKGLPKEAIKFLKKNTSNEVVVTNETENEAAFALDNDVRGNIEIYVEDRLSQALITKALEGRSEFAKEKININILPGGANTIINEFIRPASLFAESVFFILDGDKQNSVSNEFEFLFDFKNNNFVKEKLSEEHMKKLDEIIKNVTGQKVKFHPSGNNKSRDGKQENDLKIKFLSYWMEHVFFLPCKTPELGLIKATGSLNRMEPEDKEGKKFFKTCTEEEIGSTTSEDIFYTERRFLHKLKNDCELMLEIDGIIKNILKIQDNIIKRKHGITDRI